MVEKIVILGAELHAETLGEFGVLGNDHVEVLVRRAVVGVAVYVARATEQRKREKTHIRTRLRDWRRNRNNGRSRSEGCPLGCARAITVNSRSEDFERKSSLQC